MGTGCVDWCALGHEEECMNGQTHRRGKRKGQPSNEEETHPGPKADCAQYHKIRGHARSSSLMVPGRQESMEEGATTERRRVRQCATCRLSGGAPASEAAVALAGDLPRQHPPLQGR